MKQEYMKRILILTLLVLSTATAAFAQKDGQRNGEGQRRQSSAGSLCA